MWLKCAALPFQSQPALINHLCDQHGGFNAPAIKPAKSTRQQLITLPDAHKDDLNCRRTPTRHAATRAGQSHVDWDCEACTYFNTTYFNAGEHPESFQCVICKHRKQKS